MTGGSVLVVGGSGTLGRLVVERLAAAGRSVRVMTRRPAAAPHAGDANVEVVGGDLLDPDSVTKACTNIDAVVCAAHSILGRGRLASEHVDGRAHCGLIDIARQRGVRHVVYTSVYQPAPEYDTVPFFRIKREVERYVSASGLSYTILRPTAFMDFHAHVMIGVPVLEGKPVRLIGSGQRPRNFVAARDVATFVEMALDGRIPPGETVDIGGPDNLSPLEVVAMYEQEGGRRAKISRLPLGVARAAATLARPMHPGVSQILRMAVLADTVDRPFDVRPLLARYPVQLTSLPEWLRQPVFR